MENNNFVIEDGILVAYNGDGGDVVIPEGITEIDESAFEGCSNLTSVIIPDGVKSIGNYAFSECENLASITIPDTVTDICYYAFSGCTNLESVTIGKGVRCICRSAFEFCSSLRNVYYNGDISSWCSINFDDFANPLRDGADFYVKNTLGMYELVTDLVIPAGITSIGYKAFQGCGSLLTVTVGNDVKEICYGAFSYSPFKSIVIGDNVGFIGAFAFESCSFLKSITIGKGVNRIGDGAFNECLDFECIFYNGTEAEFEKITMYEELKRQIKDEVVNVYYYSEETPAKEGNFWHYVDDAPTAW